MILNAKLYGIHACMHMQMYTHTFDMIILLIQGTVLHFNKLNSITQYTESFKLNSVKKYSFTTLPGTEQHVIQQKFWL